MFASHVADARGAGLRVGAYWYVRHPLEGTSLREQAGVVVRQLRAAWGPSLDDAPAVWLDAETVAHRLSADDLVAAARALEDAGVACAGTYTTRSYWRLRRFPAFGDGADEVPGGLWLAQWPGTAGPTGADYPGDDHRAWRPFRGRTPDLWQFTDRGSVAGFTVDVDAFRGDERELAALLAGRGPGADPSGG